MGNYVMLLKKFLTILDVEKAVHIMYGRNDHMLLVIFSPSPCMKPAARGGSTEKLLEGPQAQELLLL